MKTVMLESSSDDDDVYLNSVAKLKALKKRQTLVYDREKNVKKAEEETEELKVEIPKENVANQRPIRRGRSRKRGDGSSRRRRVIPQDSDSDLEIVSVEQPNSLADDLVIVENHVDEVLPSNEDENYELVIKILWRSKNMHRLNIRRNENFRKIFEHFADLEGVSIDEILITKKEKTIKRNDTPASINLSVIDILEGGIVKKDSTMLQNNAEKDEDVCAIKVQTTSKKNIMVSVKRDESFQVVFTKCAHDLNMEESKIKLYFDGELVTTTDTPDSLDIEDEACFDLRLSS